MGQVVQLEAPPLENVPAVQVLQEVELEGEEVYRPAGQVVQDCW